MHPKFLTDANLTAATTHAHPLSDGLLRSLQTWFLAARQHDPGRAFEQDLPLLDALLAQLEPEARGDEWIGSGSFDTSRSQWIDTMAVNFVMGLALATTQMAATRGRRPWHPAQGARSLLLAIRRGELTDVGDFPAADALARQRARLLGSFARLRSDEPTLVNQLVATMHRVAAEWPQQHNGFEPQQWPRLFVLIGFASACIGRVAVAQRA